MVKRISVYWEMELQMYRKRRNIKVIITFVNVYSLHFEANQLIYFDMLLFVFERGGLSKRICGLLFI
jgi:hypothetical protein